VSEETPKPEEAEPEPKPAKKKKKKKADPEAAAAASDPRAIALAGAFDAGDFVRVRELATELAKSDDAALASVGNDYLARIAVDPIQLAFLGLCAVAILTIAWIYVPH
jgi:hypothetical protein